MTYMNRISPVSYTHLDVYKRQVYKVGLVNADYGFSTAVGLFNAVISIILLTTTNYIAKKTTDTGIW